MLFPGKDDFLGLGSIFPGWIKMFRGDITGVDGWILILVHHFAPPVWDIITSKNGSQELEN
jgi:hypothetical protein